MDDGNRKSAELSGLCDNFCFALGEAGVTWKDIIVAINVGYEFLKDTGAASQDFMVFIHRDCRAMACGAAWQN
ncbi:MAG: hypothetical protein ACLUD1_03725 [Clostridia bacterium]